MIDRKQTIYDIERCTCHVPDACRDCSKYKKGRPILSCMEDLLNDAMELLKKQPEIVRCKDCKHAVLTTSGEVKYCKCWQSDENGTYGGDPLYLDGNYYCADGERKIENGYDARVCNK